MLLVAISVVMVRRVKGGCAWRSTARKKADEIERGREPRTETL